MEAQTVKITPNLANYFKNLLAEQQAMNVRVQREIGILAESHFKVSEPGKEIVFSDDFTEISLKDAPQPQPLPEPKKEVTKK